MASTFSGKLYDRRFLTRYNNLSSVYADVLPNDIKEVIQWSEFIVANVPLVASAIEKMSSVSITNLNYHTEDLSELATEKRRSWKNIMENSLEVIDRLQEIGYNYMLSGNVFLSVFFPVERQVQCAACGAKLRQNNFANKSDLKPSSETVRNVRRLGKDKDDKNKRGDQEEILVFKGACPVCRKQSLFTLHDISVKNDEAINIVSWPVTTMEFVTDYITGRSTYYHRIPNSQKKLINNGYLDMLFHLPQDIILAAVKGTPVKFDESKILHLKRKKMYGTNTGWGMPILTSAIPDMISLLLTRKAQERILSDMIFPLRGLSPSSVGQDGQAIYNYMQGSEVSKKIESILASYKNNPTGIKYFPIPLQAITAFGEGKQLNLANEIDQISTMVMNAIGVPVEFVKGGLGYTAAGASIRVLENQLMGLTHAMEKALNFIARKVAEYKDKEPVTITITPFRLVDDIAEKQIVLKLLDEGKISDSTVSAMFKLDSQMERERILEEQKRGIREQSELQQFQQEITQNLEEKAKTEAMLSQSSTKQVNQQAIMQEADSIAQQLLQLQQGQRRSELDRLQKEDWLLYAAVKDRMEFLEQKQVTELKYEARGGQ